MDANKGNNMDINLFDLLDNIDPAETTASIAAAEAFDSAQAARVTIVRNFDGVGASKERFVVHVDGKPLGPAYCTLAEAETKAASIVNDFQWTDRPEF